MKRTFSEIANDIINSWKSDSKIYAQQYLEALTYIHSTNKHDKYFLDDAETIALYALSNMSSFRGEKARELKKELKELLK